MVATQYARGAAVAIVALFLFTLLPVTPVQAQGGGGDISIQPGEALWYQSNVLPSRATKFVDNSTTAIALNVTVYNVGPAISNVPVYYYYPDAPDRTGCKLVTFATGSAANPAKGFVNFTDIANKPLAPGGWNVTIEVFPPDTPPLVDADGTDCANPARPFSVANCNNPVTCRAETSSTNNVANAYYVKDRYLDLKILQLRWCQGAPDPQQPDCFDMENDDGSLHNVTPFNTTGSATYAPTYTFFEAVVQNDASHDWSWANTTDYGSASGTAGFGLELNVTVTGHNITGSRWVSNVATLTDRKVDDPENPELIAYRLWSGPFEIDGLAGDYNVTVQTDPRAFLRRAPADATVDVDRMDVEVAYRDFTGNFTAGTFKTSAADAYPYESIFEIAGNLTFKNLGPAGLYDVDGAGGSGPIEPNITIYLDNLSWTDASGTVHENTQFVKTLTYDVVAGSTAEVPSVKYYELFWEASNDEDSARYLLPGRHTIHVTIDHDETNDGAYFEIDEANNNFSLDVYIEDDSRPSFPSLPKIALQTSAGYNTPPLATPVRPHEPFNLYVDVVDDDINLNVTANFTHTYVENGTTLTAHREFYGRRTVGSAFEGYVVQVFDLGFHNFSAVPFNGTENWTVVVRANDSFGNNATSGAQTVRLKGWPIHNATADFIVEIPDAYPADNLSWNGLDEPTWIIRVLPNMTGYDDRTSGFQQFRTQNIAYNITFTSTGLTRNMNGSFWQAMTPPALNGTAGYPAPGCEPAPSGSGGQIPDLEGPETCDESLNNTFKAVFLRTENGAVPGIWNYSIRISDIANYTRVINGTLFLEDLKPVIENANLSGATSVAPPGTIVVNANVTDDNNDVEAVHLNLTRIAPGDEHVMNVTLTEFDEDGAEGETWFLYNQTLEVGRFKQIGAGGTYNASIHAVDNVGNWAQFTIGQIEIVDNDAPLVGAAGVVPPVVEIGENVTFWANASDATNLTMKLEIFRSAGSQELLLDPIFISQEGTGPTFNYTTVLNFSEEAVHSWRMTAIDSVNNPSTPVTGTLTVRDNLGPKYDVRSPSVVIDGTRYGSGTPRIEVVVQDVEGVLGSSIDMTVADLAVDFEVGPAPGNINGYLVTYTVPASKKFNHNDVVNVSISAQDESPEQLTSTLNFSFVVDDVAPTARLVSISPSYRDQPAHVMNVSLASRITLAAEDVDGIPTAIPTGGIRYRILGGGTSAETVYSGPFKINDAPGVYTGPRLYQIQYWAEDDVGNFDRNFEITTVFVDDTPPALFQFFPQGRNINATFVDDRVGVNRSVVWYRINDQAYLPLPLSEDEGTWTLTLPEGVKGDRISYYLQAWDRLDNTETFGNATNPYASFDVSNHEPRVRISAPAEGSRVSRTMDLTWEASDEDGDALVYTIYYRAPGRSNFVELAKIENTATKSYRVDTTRYPDGIYTFRVAAGDGGFVKLAETTVTIINRVDPIGVVEVTGEALPGSEMLITAEVTKAEAIVEAHLFLGDTLVGSYPMNDNNENGDEVANDGIYSVRVPIEAAGDYRVEIFTEYREDGELKRSSIESAATFSAKLTPSYVLTEYGPIIALIGLLAAVAIGVGVFVVMRRR